MNIHQCIGTDAKLTVIRYSEPKDAWLMLTADGGKSKIHFCPYCGSELDEELVTEDEQG
ncbi:hypothetical protein [Paenibacillus illinoisensis]|uniref:hypothetical protein n=1 Tax=Paenibacillus illinoisensis TaxID=59845 RepID=UPI00203AD5DE|nr:hypothetical protein [Paenibacillus illinoisensis]MCM3208511.1 hypothetical protein [Paenibacillus illinoisensis]